MMSYRAISQFLLFCMGLLFVMSPLLAASVEERLQQLERQVKEFKETGAFNNQRLAEALATFELVREEMAQFKGEIERISHISATDIGQRQADLQAMDHRLTRMEERLATLALTLKEMAAFKAKKPEKPGAQELLYEEAFSELTQRNYQEAMRLFGQFVQQYPKDRLTDNAQYWVGECHFALGDYQKAILEFQRVVTKYPDGNKVPAAILKQGFAFIELKSYADSKAFLEKVIRTYPKTPEALQAREKLALVEKLLKEAATAAPPSLNP